MVFASHEGITLADNVIQTVGWLNRKILDIIKQQLTRRKYENLSHTFFFFIPQFLFLKSLIYEGDIDNKMSNISFYLFFQVFNI